MTPPTSSQSRRMVVLVIPCDRFPSRKSPRMKHFDYASPNYYFITICTRDRACLFGRPGALNPLGRVAMEGILKIEDHFPGVTVDKFVIMPNHVHAIVILNGSADLSAIIGLYKSYVTKNIRKWIPDLKVWQTSFHDHVIRNQTAYEKIWLYIDSNPNNWGKDCFFEPL